MTSYACLVDGEVADVFPAVGCVEFYLIQARVAANPCGVWAISEECFLVLFPAIHMGDG